MELNKYDIESLEDISDGIEKTLEITNLYLTFDDVKELNRIIRKVKRVY